ncbi:hypothetical protein EJB05_00586, partial [Eragrostis curvula]
MVSVTPLLVANLLLATVAALCFCGVAGASVDTVANSCGAISDFVDVGFCVAAGVFICIPKMPSAPPLSVPGAASADRHAHLLTAADLATASGAAARDGAAGTARDELNPAARDALEACVILYGSGSVPALRLLRGYAAARSWAAARALLPLTGQAGIRCDAALGDAPAAGKMAAANREFEQLTTMTTALLNSVGTVS